MGRKKTQRYDIDEVPKLMQLFLAELPQPHFLKGVSVKRASIWRLYKGYLEQLGVNRAHSPKQFYALVAHYYNAIQDLKILPPEKGEPEIPERVSLIEFRNYDVFMNIHMAVPETVKGEQIDNMLKQTVYTKR